MCFYAHDILAYCLHHLSLKWHLIASNTKVPCLGSRYELCAPLPPMLMLNDFKHWKELIGKDEAQLQAHKTQLIHVSIVLDLSTLQHPLLLNSVWKYARESGDLYATKFYTNMLRTSTSTCKTKATTYFSPWLVRAIKPTCGTLRG